MKENYIQINGKNDKGPWEVIRFDKDELPFGRKAERFGGLCKEIIELLKGQNVEYSIEYKSPHGFVFEETEEKVIYYIVDSHNRFVSIKKNLEEAIN